VVFYLRVDVKEGLHRVKNVRKEGVTFFEKEEYLKKVCAIFDKMDFDYFHTIDASLPPENVSAEIMRILNNKLWCIK